MHTNTYMTCMSACPTLANGKCNRFTNLQGATFRSWCASHTNNRIMIRNTCTIKPQEIVGRDWTKLMRMAIALYFLEKTTMCPSLNNSDHGTWWPFTEAAWHIFRTMQYLQLSYRRTRLLAMVCRESWDGAKWNFVQAHEIELFSHACGILRRLP